MDAVAFVDRTSEDRRRRDRGYQSDAEHRKRIASGVDRRSRRDHLAAELASGHVDRPRLEDVAAQRCERIIAAARVERGEALDEVVLVDQIVGAADPSLRMASDAGALDEHRAEAVAGNAFAQELVLAEEE